VFWWYVNKAIQYFLNNKNCFIICTKKFIFQTRLSTVKISDRKVRRRNEILSFFTFWSVFKIRKFFCDIIILLTNVFGDIKRSIKLPKTFSEGIRRNCGQKVYFGSTRWVRPKLGSKRTLKMLKIRKFEIQTSISPAG